MEGGRTTRAEAGNAGHMGTSPHAVDLHARLASFRLGALSTVCGCEVMLPLLYGCRLSVPYRVRIKIQYWFGGLRRSGSRSGVRVLETCERIT